MSTSPKERALSKLKVAAVRLVVAKHDACRKLDICLQEQDLRLAALGYSLETLRAIAVKRDDATKAPGQACRESVAQVVAELEATLVILAEERRMLSNDHGATQLPGAA